MDILGTAAYEGYVCHEVTSQNILSGREFTALVGIDGILYLTRDDVTKVNDILISYKSRVSFLPWYTNHSDSDRNTSMLVFR